MAKKELLATIRDRYQLDFVHLGGVGEDVCELSVNCGWGFSAVGFQPRQCNISVGQPQHEVRRFRYVSNFCTKSRPGVFQKEQESDPRRVHSDYWPNPRTAMQRPVPATQRLLLSRLLLIDYQPHCDDHPSCYTKSNRRYAQHNHGRLPSPYGHRFSPPHQRLAGFGVKNAFHQRRVLQFSAGHI